MRKLLLLVFFVALGGVILGNQEIKAADFVKFRGLPYPLEKDYVVVAPNSEVSLKVLAGSSSQKLSLKMMTITSKNKIKNFLTLPADATPASDLYFIKFFSDSEHSFSVSPQLTIKYEADNHYKEAYFYDWIDLKFVKLDSTRDTLNNTLTVNLPERKKIMIALFDESALVGKASWYVYPKYSGELIAASRDFAKESQVKVTNLYNNKEVVVTIKDYGPKLCADWTEKEQRLMGPCQERILDLSKTAFLQLATTTGVGIISGIKVEPIINDMEL
jgi:rare lipoprotein A (peptidoglycan hydrolase)